MKASRLSQQKRNRADAGPQESGTSPSGSEEQFSITEIRPQPGKKGRLQVYLEGSGVFILTEKEVGKLGLAVGKKLTAEKLEQLREADELRRAKEYATLLLSYRSRTLSELRQRLARKGFSETTIAAVMKRLAELKLVDDARFAQDYAEARIRTAGRSRRLVQAELNKLGVGRAEIEEALAAAPDESVAARALLEKVKKRYAGLEEKVRRQRLFSLLARRGFSYDTIRRVMGMEDYEET